MKYNVIFSKSWEYIVEASNATKAIENAEELFAFDASVKADSVEVEVFKPETLSEQITQLMDEKFLNESGRYSRFGESEDATDSIVHLLEEAGLTKNQYSVDYSVALYSPAGDYGCLSVAYIEDGEVKQLMFDIE